MTKIWTLSTCGTGGRVCSASNLIGARRKPGGRRPGNPVSRRATKNRFFVHIPPLHRPPVFLFNFSLSASLLLELNANAPLTSHRFSHLLSLRIGRRRFFFRISCRQIVEPYINIGESYVFGNLPPPFDSNSCSFFSIFSVCPIDRACDTKICIVLLHLFRVLIFNRWSKIKD